ncbi:hypothetical protein PybrP1_010059 [[Pythium] brassicae (nom. inval.)]|nr:hypothetical protein PybrP1_010059 [[Pythium] brassicae (nom. inval.)]
MRRKSSAARLPLRKSMSNAAGGCSSPSHLSLQPTQPPLQQVHHYQTSASLRSVLAAADPSSFADQPDGDLAADPEVIARRQHIVQRAEEIQRSARHVGMQFGETCPVCLADDVDAQLTACGHRIHAKCIKRWIQSGTRCPVCREQVTGVQEAFTPPSSAHFGAFQKDREASAASSDDASTSPDEGDDDDNRGPNGNGAGFEWGWFEDFDEFDELNDDSVHAGLGQRRASLPNLPGQGGPLSSPSCARSRSGSHSALLNRELSGTFEICRTFPPLRPMYDAPYAVSRHTWMRVLPSHRHIAAKIQIRSFRIVEARPSRAQHAEYLVELQLDGRYFSRWRRFSAISRFVSTVGSSEFRETHAVWAKLEAASRWFNRLELSYLHERCKLLEQFAHTLLIECSTAHPLADLLDA